MLAGLRDRSRPSASAHQFRVVLYSRFLLGPRKSRHEKMIGNRPRRFRSCGLGGWGSKKRNPFSVHQSLTLCEVAPPGQAVYGVRPSPPEPELGDNRSVALDVGALQIVQQPAALADQLEQPAPRVVVVGVRLEMVGEVIDPFAEDRDLDFGRPGVLLVEAVRLDHARLDACCQSVYLLNSLARVPLASRTLAHGQG